VLHSGIDVGEDIEKKSMGGQLHHHTREYKRAHEQFTQGLGGTREQHRRPWRQKERAQST
jgi:hypothetical protein